MAREKLGAIHYLGYNSTILHFSQLFNAKKELK